MDDIKLFSEIMVKLDIRFQKQNRKVLLILDICSSHPKLELNSIEFLYLPPNTTSRLQPLDAGIIWSFKQNYRKNLLKFIINFLDDNEDKDCEDALKKLTLINAINMIESTNKSMNK